MMENKMKNEILAVGIRVLLSRHPEIRKLKTNYFPSNHGNKFWTSSWLLMDYFKRNGMPNRSRVMEIGCGWGLAGIYLAKKYNARVTGVDVDADIFPFLHLHANINKVKISTMNKGFDKLTRKCLMDTGIMLGADICFWDDMIDPLKRLILRALRAGVKLVLIADPCRPPFQELCEYFADKRGGEILDWSVRRPRPIQGQILKIET
jgi:predicted nicotinamide N-methyase